MMRRPARSVLHLQMGQEVLYLLMTIGIMSSLVLLMYTRFLQIENADYRARQGEAANELETLHDNIALLEELRDKTAVELNELRGERDRLLRRNPVRDDQPPIITLTEAQGYYFPSGSAALSDAFRELIASRIVPRILDISRLHDAQVIEVVGHTDEVPVRSLRSTIDGEMLDFLNRRSPEPRVSDNVGLGMVRAAAVVRELRQDPNLGNLTILPLSAGHTTTQRHQLSPGVSPPQEDQQRRRIEIRVRRHFRR